MVLLPNVTEAIALQKAEASLAQTKGLNIQYSGKQLPNITVSAGIAFYPNDATDVRSLILVADKALYKAKFKGRDQVVLGGHEKPH